MIIMIVAIPVDEEIKSAYLFEKFGRAPVFAILKTDKGFTKFIPNKSSTSSGGAGVATNYTITGTDCDGNALVEVIAVPGAGTVQGTRAFATITRVQSDLDPTVTTDVQSGNGFGLGAPFNALDAVGVDGVLEAPVSSHGATGTIVPTTVPNAAHEYTVDYRALPTAANAAHDHGAATGADGAHDHTSPTGAGSSHTHALS